MLKYSDIYLRCYFKKEDLVGEGEIWYISIDVCVYINSLFVRFSIHTSKVYVGLLDGIQVHYPVFRDLYWSWFSSLKYKGDFKTLSHL